MQLVEGREESQGRRSQRGDRGCKTRQRGSQRWNRNKELGWERESLGREKGQGSERESQGWERVI
jgi:hypothetical protein